MLQCGVAFVPGRDRIAGTPLVRSRIMASRCTLAITDAAAYGDAERIAVEELGLGTGMVETHGVDDQVVRRDAEAEHRASSIAMRVAW